MSKLDDRREQKAKAQHRASVLRERVRAEASAELRPVARRVIERRKLKRGDRPRCMMASKSWTLPHRPTRCIAPMWREWLHGCPGKCISLRAGIALPTCSMHFTAWLNLVGFEWAAKSLGIVPFDGWPRRRRVIFRWPASPCRPPALFSSAGGPNFLLSIEQALVLADVAEEIGKPEHAEMIRDCAYMAELDRYEAAP